MVLEDLLRLNFLELLVIWAGFAVATGIGKALVKGWNESNDVRAGRQRSCGKCNITFNTNIPEITKKLMDDHNNTHHEGKSV